MNDVTCPEPADRDKGPAQAAAGAVQGASRRTVLAGSVAAGAAVLGAAAPSTAASQDAPAGKSQGRAMTWTTLGTASGPEGHPDRAQPASLLRTADQTVLVDAGDGVVDQLMKAGVNVQDVTSVVLSHLHIDHTGGLWGLLGRRFQLAVTDELVIYGPPGTRETVAGILAGQGPLHDLALVQDGPSPATAQRVVEVDAGRPFEVGGVRVTSTANTHYATATDSAGSGHVPGVSLSYRFEWAGRSIVFTGDTGPCPDVDRLARGADLLVSEIIDVEDALAQLVAERPDLTATQLAAVRDHFTREHLTADQVGLLARRARVGRLVLTHIGMSDGAIPAALRAIGDRFRGEITFAADLQTFRSL